MISLSLAAVLMSPVPYTLPLEGAQPLTKYMTCLMEPASRRIATGLPSDRTERESIVRSILSDCASTRSRSAAEADARIANSPGYANAAIRRTNIEGFLSGWEQTLRLMIIDNEQFVAAGDAFCRDRGEPPGC